MAHHDHDPEPGLTRRDFLRQTGFAALAGLAGWRALEAAAPAPFTAAKPLATVVLVRDDKALGAEGAVNAQVVARMLNDGVRALTGKQDDAAAWSQLARAEDRFGIKFSRCGWMRVPTHQEVIDAVAAGLHLASVPKERISVMDYGLKPTDCTALINVSSLKARPLTGFAAAIKNYINFDPKPEAFHDAGCQRLGEIWTRPEVKGKARLIVLDLLTPYFGTGPQIDPRYQADYRGVLVATDPVAADTVALHLCQKLRDQHKKKPWPLSPPPLFLAAADKEYRLGTSDPAKIKLVWLGWEKGRLV